MRADDPALVSFAEDLRQEVLLIADVEGSELLRPEAFTQRMIETLVEAGELEEALPAHHRDRGIEVAAYGIEDGETLNLLACDYRGEVPPASVTRTDVTTAMRRLLGMWERCRERPYHEQLEESADAYDMARHIHQAAGGIRRIRLVLISDALAAVEYFEPEQMGGVEVRRQVWDVGRLQRLESSGNGREPVGVDFIERFGRAIPCLAAGTPGADYSAYLAVLPGRVLADIYDEYGARLLELNVRSFLQATGKVNRGIRDSLLHEPERFLAYNNGISATASEVELVDLPEGGTGLARIRDLQIVNGGQTTASVHRLRDRDLDHVRVQAKITVIAAERLDEVVPLISRYANSQNKVQEADLSSNHPWHVALEGLSRTVWAPATGDTMRQTRWFYERARGSYRDAESREGTPARRRAWKHSHPPRQRMTKTDVAKYENTWDQLPHEVSRGAQKNFTVFMGRLRERDSGAPDVPTFQRLVAKAILFRRVERIVSDQEFGGYRANIVTYTLAKLSHATAQRVDLDAIWERQAVPEPVEEAITELSHLAYDALVTRAPAGANITEWAKRDRCWTLLREELWQVPEPLTETLVGRGRRVAGSTAPADERESVVVESMSSVPADDWFAIANWAKETDNLTPWQRRFAYDIGRRVARGTTLSPKQAAQARKVIDAAAGLRFTPPGQTTGQPPVSDPSVAPPPSPTLESDSPDAVIPEGRPEPTADTPAVRSAPVGSETAGVRSRPPASSDGADDGGPAHEAGADPHPLDRPVEDVLSRRAANCLRRVGIATLREAAAYTPDQLTAIPNLGGKMLTEILTAIGDHPRAGPTDGADNAGDAGRGSDSGHPPRPPSARAAEVIALREQGLPLSEIGRRVGVTAERVRQILDRDAAHLTAAHVAGVRRTQRLEDALDHADDVLAQFRAGSDPAEIARTLVLSTEAVREVIELNATDGDRAQRRGAAFAHLEPRYSDEECLGAIRTVGDLLGRSPSAGEYAARAGTLGLPSLPTLQNRLGSWNAAVAAAGLTPRERKRTYTRRWDEDACLAALRGLLEELGHWPSAQYYEALATTREDLPSLPTARNRLGRWSEIGAQLIDERDEEGGHQPTTDSSEDRDRAERKDSEAEAIDAGSASSPSGGPHGSEGPGTPPATPESLAVTTPSTTPPRWAGARPGRQLPDEVERARALLRRRLRGLREH